MSIPPRHVIIRIKQTGTAPIEKNRSLPILQLHIVNLFKGVIPITKNIIVTDAQGNQIGTTYPKRAKGLVKSGRAEYANDCEIRLLITHAPAVTSIDNTEDLNMSKIINFNAKDFHFDASCENNVGARMIQHNHLGQNETVFEIGDWYWSWTQIISSKHLEKNTDYLFRFAIELGINDTGDAVCQLYIVRDKNYEDRDVYPLQQSRFLPVLSKDGPNGLLRVFEVPFNSGDAEITDLIFVAQHAITRVLPAHDLKDYDVLEDLSYSEWWEARSAAIAAEEEAETANYSSSRRVRHLDLCGANISSSMLQKLLKSCTENIDLTGANIYWDGDEEEDFEESDSAADENAGRYEHIMGEAQDVAQAAIKRAYDAVKARYDAAPQNSIQKESLKFAMDQLVGMLAKQTTETTSDAEEGADGKDGTEGEEA